MSTTTSINFKENYFKYPSLTKIRGEPSVESLTILIRQLLANAKKVPNDEHATYGYIGLILSDEEYAALTPAPTAVFRAPAIPVEPRDGGTQFEIQQRMHTYKEQQKRRAEYILMHNTMFNLIQEAIESEYLEAKVDPLTGDFDCTIPELIAYLKTTYGYISPAELQEKQDEVTKMVWDISKPVDFVFNKIDTVASLFDMARKTLTRDMSFSRLVHNDLYLIGSAPFNRTTARNRSSASFSVSSLRSAGVSSNSNTFNLFNLTWSTYSSKRAKYSSNVSSGNCFKRCNCLNAE
jgi:hypothetical protein